MNVYNLLFQKRQHRIEWPLTMFVVLYSTATADGCGVIATLVDDIDFKGFAVDSCKGRRHNRISPHQIHIKGCSYCPNNEYALVWHPHLQALKI